MKFTNILKGVSASVVLLLSGCNPTKEKTDDHAGHDHGAKSDAPHVENDICGEHNVPEEDCGICNPDKVTSLKPGESLQLRLASKDSAEVAGVKTAKPMTGTVAAGLEVYAEITFDQNKFAQIAAPVSGVIQEVITDNGQHVTENQSVARIWSAQIAEAVAKASLSHQNLERERKLRAQQVTAQKDLDQAEADHRAVCQGLRTLGFTEEKIDELSEKPQEAILLDARAPFAGIVVERKAIRGALVEVGTPLFTIADLSVMWAELAIPETALPRLKTGQEVELTADSYPDRTFKGKLTWISAELDETTRMAKARVEVPNPDGILKARMFAKARILTDASSPAVRVPSSAIQRVDGKPFVFVKLGPDLFDARAVRVGPQSGDSWIISEGLKPNEEIATEHAFTLKSQLLISRLGAGCADD